MPRLKQVSRAEATPDIHAFYDMVFGKDVDPTVTPGTAQGTPGNFFTTYANHPAILKALGAFSVDRPNPDVKTDAKLRPIVLGRTGYAVESQLVYSQQFKAARMLGVPEEKMQAIACWTVANCYSDVERALLALVDGMVLEKGRVHDRVFEILRAHLSDAEIIEFTYLINQFMAFGAACKVLKMEYDDVPERIVEIPIPKTRRAQDHLRPETWDQ